jgi:hypothetical protein
MAPEILQDADFRTLGLEPGSKPSEVKRAYRTLVKKWHPDRHHSETYENRALAEKKFREIDEAYKRISGRWKETARPESLHRKSTGQPASPFRVFKRRGEKHRFKTDARARSKIDNPILSRAKIVSPLLLLSAAAALILFRLSPFSSNRSFVEETAHEHKTSSSQPVVNTGNSVKSPVAGGQTSVFSNNRQREANDRPGEGLQPPSPGSNSSVAGPDGRKGLFIDDRPGMSASVDPLFSLPPDLLNSKPSASNSFFSMGSTASEVLAVQGTPSRVQGQTWIYGLSEVQFRNGRVSRFNNFDGSLRVHMVPESPEDGAQLDHIEIGSSEQQVLAVQGTPTRVEGNRWFYGFAEILFKDGRIAEYDNYFGALKMRVTPSSSYSDSESPKDVFTIGSLPDEVLAVQGTPTSVHGNLWSYGFASVIFKDGKVRGVIDAGRRLHFVATEKK